MNIVTSPNLNYLWSLLIVEELTRLGVDYFCISPGSRSSPLTMAVGFNPKTQSFVHFDERGTAFHALGYVSANKKPAVLIATSGTALANMFPAIIEASKKKLPLIILTADRPPELRNTGANQTIDQVKIFGDYVRFFFDLPTPTEEIRPEFVLTTIDQAVARAKGELPGPVHINVMLREPLSPVKAQLNTEHYLRSIPAWLESAAPYTTYNAYEKTLSVETIDHITGKINDIKSGLIVCGKLGGKEDMEAALKLSEKLHWPIFADITSGLRLGQKNKNIISYFDQILLSDAVGKHLKIDGILHLGGRMTSKRYYDFIEHHRPADYIMVINHPLRNDPAHVTTERVQSKIHHFVDVTIDKLTERKANVFLTYLQKANTTVHEMINHYFESQNELFESPHDLCEPEVARMITQHIGADSGLFIASSLPIRDMDMYAVTDKNSVVVSANRGASGIDGIIASAAGFCKGIKKSTTLLVGDLAFLYDLNSLTMLKALDKPLTIVVINNDGGGIFNFLPIARDNKQFEKFFGTPHQLTFEHAAKLFELNYHKPKTKTEFIDVYIKSAKAKHSTIIEIESSRENNVKVHQNLQKKIAVAITENS
jgi:2-succinyl-5-enolpyruvyl-6-hydroxy-3-cyclohexene-1-carboxylate synthase